MTLSLAQVQALNELADHLYPFLPGKAHPFANQDISFAAVAASLGLGRFWPGGSKLPAISQLLVHTRRDLPEKFCLLITEVVQRGMTYRQNRGQPITREEIDLINDLVAKVGFKIPELWDPKFLGSQPRTPQTSEEAETATLSQSVLEDLKTNLREIVSLGPQERGFQFEKFLGDVFETFGLAPRGSFRLVGEQIDGSFQFQGETYLVEAKWRNDQIGEESLLAFSGKIKGKAQWSRGLMISYSGFSREGLEAFAKGKSTNVICLDGYDLYSVLDAKLDLRDVLERKARRAAETNDAHVSVRYLFPNVF